MKNYTILIMLMLCHFSYGAYLVKSEIEYKESICTGILGSAEHTCEDSITKSTVKRRLIYSIDKDIYENLSIISHKFLEDRYDIYLHYTLNKSDGHMMGGIGLLKSTPDVIRKYITHVSSRINIYNGQLDKNEIEIYINPEDSGTNVFRHMKVSYSLDEID